MKYKNHRPHLRLNTIRCRRCYQIIPFWPKGGAIVTNDSGTEEMVVCSRCLGQILNMRGVQVINDNVGRDE